SNNQIYVDHRFRGQPRHGCRANVFDIQSDSEKCFSDLTFSSLKQFRPFGRICFYLNVFSSWFARDPRVFGRVALKEGHYVFRIYILFPHAAFLYGARFTIGASWPAKRGATSFMSQTRPGTPAAIAGGTRSPTAPAARLNTLRRGCVMVSRRSLQRDADRCCDAANCRSEALMRPSEENNLSMIPGHLIRRDTPCSRPMTASGSSLHSRRRSNSVAYGAKRTSTSSLQNWIYEYAPLK